MAVIPYWMAMTLWSWLQMYLVINVSRIVMFLLVIAIGNCNVRHRTSPIEC